MHRLSIALAIAGLLSLGGCKSFYGDYSATELRIDQNSAALTLREAITKKTVNGVSTGIVDNDCIAVPVAGGSAAACQQQRNAALAVLMIASDELCQTHFKTIYGNDASFNIVTGTVATLFSGAAAIAGSASAKSALSAISAFSSAERSLVNETVYKNMIVTAVTKKIREGRDAKAASMLPANLDKSIADYPVLFAVYDAVAYHQRCSFMYGLEKALDEGNQIGNDVKLARLENEKRSLEMYVQARRTILKQDKVEAGTDPGFTGALGRIREIEAQLLALIKTPVSIPTTGSR